MGLTENKSDELFVEDINMTAGDYVSFVSSKASIS